jgi:DNA invertase Pin-like site-specific DNA recombinase
MLTAIYARVSTTDQHCEVQLRELRDYIKRRGWKNAGEYVDEGISGTRASRPALDRLMQDAAEHRFDCVMVWKLDRFGRSVLNLAQHLQRLEAAGVRFIAVTQSIDTDAANPTSRLLLHILSAVAEFEREMIKERTVAGVRRAIANGKKVGRPKKVFRRDLVVELHGAGKSARVIAGELGIPRSTVQRVLQVAQNPPASDDRKSKKKKHRK